MQALTTPPELAAALEMHKFSPLTCSNKLKDMDNRLCSIRNLIDKNSFDDGLFSDYFYSLASYLDNIPDFEAIEIIEDIEQSLLDIEDSMNENFAVQDFYIQDFIYFIFENCKKFSNSKYTDYMAILAGLEIYKFINEKIHIDIKHCEPASKFIYRLIGINDLIASFHGIRMAEDERANLYEHYEYQIENQNKTMRSEWAKKAGRAKQSPYEKAGTVAAVNNLLREKQSMLMERGGKAELNRIILDLIVSGAIPAPLTPTPKTVDSWIDKFKKTEMS